MKEHSKQVFSDLQNQIERQLEAYLSQIKIARLQEAMAYSLLNGGKRIRPLLCLLSCQAVSGQFQSALHAACALEMIHTYSLIHDDLPALDNDDWRRGKASNHKVYGEDMAILAGDALMALAFEALAQQDELPADIQLKTSYELARASGPAGMCGGQVLDMQADMDSAEAALAMYALKTGALIRASVRMGALIGGASSEQLEHLTIYAEQLGQAFQIVDDLLDLTGSLDTLGKTPGKDVLQQKRTYATFYGVEASQQKVKNCLQVALDALEQADLQETHHLKALAYLLVERSH